MLVTISPPPASAARCPHLPARAWPTGPCSAPRWPRAPLTLKISSSARISRPRWPLPGSSAPGWNPVPPTSLWRDWGISAPCSARWTAAERQHPAVPHPSGKPYRAVHHLCGPRAADGTASICIRNVISRAESPFRAGKRAADRGRKPAQRGVHAGGQCVQPVHQRAAVRPAPADGDSTLHLIPPVESRSYIEMTRAAQAVFGVTSHWLDDTTLCIPGGQQYHPPRLHRGGRLQPGSVPRRAGGRQGRHHSYRAGR